MKIQSVTVEELNRCREAVKGHFSPMVEQFRGDWKSTVEGGNDKLQAVDLFLKIEPQATQGLSLALFSIGSLPQGISHNEVQDFIKDYFSMPVQPLKGQEIDSLPCDAWRSFGGFVPQADANWILDHVLCPLKERHRTSHWGIIALTNEDLLCDPNDVLDYVYGLSNKNDPNLPGIAIISTRRIWQPNAVGIELSRSRLYKVIAHEIGHLFYLRHCLTHACLMNGVETIDQIDRHPIGLCPDCMAKFCWIAQIQPKTCYEHLIAICQKLNMSNEAGLYQKCLELLTGVLKN
jgi:predicted Zn-dependent protease